MIEAVARDFEDFEDLEDLEDFEDFGEFEDFEDFKTSIVKREMELKSPSKPPPLRMVPSRPLIRSNKRLREQQFDATGFNSEIIEFQRNGKHVSATIEYPQNPPDEDLHYALTRDTDTNARELLCPGCSDQDIFLKRCHGCIITDHVHSKHPQRLKLIPRGILGVNGSDKMVELLDRDGNVFIGRRAPRGVATKSIGVKTTLSRSRYANPFIISKKGFTLGESLALYQAWIDRGCRPLDTSEVQTIVDNAPKIPETIAEMLVAYPELFR